MQYFAIIAFTLLVGRQEEHPACKNWVMRRWHDLLICMDQLMPLSQHYLLLH